ncbi:hypothetical protein CLCR_08434 [Cladophialophora carrionii]|uniref:Uncharacterized protein n=1 Tax=Cladophialophora carrionii TaxID=86049 RepID=A0A1C1CS97_9EURO|nr:hypothetical protein CLCR_08434 [Cladophialophora carrionii]
MTAARLSPAANLLRTSRLFSIPAAVSLPAVEPSSEPISYSDSATTPYPTRAAIETPLASLNQGDWGLKRPLPIKTTTKSGTPLVRFRRGIDTPEHVVDFESAADHVLTLRKYQELNLRVTLPAPRRKSVQDQQISPFEVELDHTADQLPPRLDQKTSISWLDQTPSERAQRIPGHLKDAMLKVEKDKGEMEKRLIQSQPTDSAPAPSVESLRRWRYSGPYLAGLNGLEFDAFLKTITREKRAAFRELVKNDLVEKRAHEQRLKALDEGQPDVSSQSADGITEEDVTEHMRYLRNEPGKFGPLIAKFFDLADGPNPSSDMSDPWSYGRDTIAADLYRESGPPRTHPSAGLSYLKTEASAANSPTTGPRASRDPVAARLLKSRQIMHNKHVPYVGVAGFVVPEPIGATAITEQVWKWEPVKDGPKLVVTPISTSVSQAGKVEIKTKRLQGWAVENDLPVDPTKRRTTTAATAPARRMSSQLPSLDSIAPRRTRPPPEPERDIDEELDLLKSMSSPKWTKRNLK